MNFMAIFLPGLKPLHPLHSFGTFENTSMPETLPEIQSFINYLRFEKRYAQHTVISYENDLTSFFTYMGNTFGPTPLNALSHSLIRSWLAELKDAGLKSKSINRKI